MYIDTHTHLFAKEFDEDRTKVVQRAIDAGVEKLFLPNIDVETIPAMNELVRDFPNQCYPMMGLHPGSVKADWKEQLQVIEKELFAGKYIAVGEMGMDLYWDTTFVKEQREVFTQQVLWAKELGLPIVIHAREAFEEIFTLLDSLNDEKLTGVFHCFTGTVEQAKHIMSYGGFKFGIGGVVTYKKVDLGPVLVEIPLEQLILETDSPYLSPVPFRGKRNESAYLLHIAQKVSDIYQIPLKKVEEQTTWNALELFKLTT
jgi:TatD DNase family protein